ncbi:MAG: hypothetical protein ACOCUL_02620 [Bacteroidota bacterium]
MMKLKILLLVMLSLLAFPLMAQTANSSEPSEILITMFSSLGAMAAGVTVITEFLKSALKIKGFLAQYLSWIVALVAGLTAFWFEWGIFAEVHAWYTGVIISLGAGLIANGIFDTKIVHAILKAILKAGYSKNMTRRE